MLNGWIFLKGCHHPGGSFIYWTHVTHLTCKANVLYINSSCRWIYNVCTNLKWRGKFWRIFCGVEFRTCDLKMDDMFCSCFQASTPKTTTSAAASTTCSRNLKKKDFFRQNRFAFETPFFSIGASLVCLLSKMTAAIHVVLIRLHLLYTFCST